METITDYESLLKRLRKVPLPVTVGLEGFTGSGKSYLAGELQRDLDACVVHTDEYVCGEDESAPYPSRLDYLRLLSDVDRAGCNSSLIIIEGICLRQVLCRGGLSASVFVYIKCLAQNGLWHEEIHLEDFKTGNEIVENREEPHLSDYTYHVIERPHERAEIIFQRIRVLD